MGSSKGEGIPSFVTTVSVVQDLNYFGSDIKEAQEAAKRELSYKLRKGLEVEFCFNTYEVSDENTDEELWHENGDEALYFKYPPVETRMSYGE